MNYSARQRFEQLLQSQGQSMAAPVQGTRSNQMLSAVRMAEGGAVGSLPTLAEMSNPDFKFQGTQLGANAPFTQMNPIVPMFNLEAPAFGGMEQSTYDFTAPVVQGGSMYQPPRQAPAMTQSTSAYRPVDATTVMDSSGNIPNVPVNPSDYLSPMASAVGGAPATTISSAIPQLITAEESARRASDAQAAQARMEQEQAAAREQAGIQAELERRRASEQAAAQAAADQEAQRLQQQEQARMAQAQAQAQAAEQARAQEQVSAAAGAEAERRQKAQAASDAAEQAERARQAEAIKRNKDNEIIGFLTQGIRGMFGGSEPEIYNPNEMVPVTRLVDGGRGGQIVEQVSRSQYDIEQARARAYQKAFGA